MTPRRSRGRTALRSTLALLISFIAPGCDAPVTDPERPGEDVGFGSLDLVVSDQLGAAVVGATVELAATPGGPAAHTARTDFEGVARFDSIGARVWRLQVEPPTDYATPDGGGADSVIVERDRRSTSRYALHRVYGEYTGLVAFAFEAAVFRLCGTDRYWWVGGVGPAQSEVYREYHRVRAEGGHEVFARVRGEVSDSGRYGHLGAYPRQIGVQEVVEVRPSRAADCATGPVSVRPANARLALGQTLQLDAAVFDVEGRAVAGADVAWSSSMPSVASADGSGRVETHALGTATITATHAGRSATSVVQVLHPAVVQGYAVVEGQATNPDGTPYVHGAVSVSCGPGITGRTGRTDDAGRFRLDIFPSEFGSMLLVSEDRRVPCSVVTSPADPPAGITYAPVRVALPGDPVVTTEVDVVRMARSSALTVSPSQPTVSPGGKFQLSSRIGTTPTTDVLYRSLIPSVASVDEQGVVTAHGYGMTVIVASLASDTTTIATTRVTVPWY